jgi:hypothetical protein
LGIGIPKRWDGDGTKIEKLKPLKVIIVEITEIKSGNEQ